MPHTVIILTRKEDEEQKVTLDNDKYYYRRRSNVSSLSRVKWGRNVTFIYLTSTFLSETQATMTTKNYPYIIRS